jgi:hypothetical protein
MRSNLKSVDAPRQGRFRHIAQEVAHYEVDVATRLIVARPAFGCEPELVANALVDGVLPRVADLRGYGLHASAVVIEGGAYVFVGPSGAGKSTLAARLAQMGALLLGDDCALIANGKVWPTFRPSRIRDRSIPLLGIQATPSPDATGKIELGHHHDVNLACSPATVAQIAVIGTEFRELGLGEAVRCLGAERLMFKPYDAIDSLHRAIDLVRSHGPILEVPRDWKGL